MQRLNARIWLEKPSWGSVTGRRFPVDSRRFNQIEACKPTQIRHTSIQTRSATTREPSLCTRRPARWLNRKTKTRRDLSPTKDRELYPYHVDFRRCESKKYSKRNEQESISLRYSTRVSRPSASKLEFPGDREQK